MSPRAGLLVLGSFLLSVAGFFWSDGVMALSLLSGAATLAVLAAGLKAVALLRLRIHRDLCRHIGQFVDGDATPSITTDADGAILMQNRAATDRFGSKGALTITAMLAEFFADPGPIAHRLMERAGRRGAAEEELVTGHGHVRLSVHKLDGLGHLWRLDDLADRPGTRRGAEGSGLPMLMASKSGTILFMNDAMRRLIGQRVRALDRIFTDLPLRSGEEHQIIGAEGPMRVLLTVFDSSAGRKEVFLTPVVRATQGYVADPTAFETLPVALLRLATDGTIREANRAARDLLGDIEVGTSMTRLFEGLGRAVSDWLADAVTGRAEHRPEVLRLSQSKKDTYLQVALTRTMENGEPALVAVLSDATQLKTLEAQFVQSQKMQAIGQLAGGIAHDFNNLLTAISGHCDLLLLRHGKNDLDYSDLIQINQNANRAASLVGQLLAFSRKQTLTPRVIDLRDTLSDLTHLLNRLVGEKVRLTFTHDPALRPVRADKRQLEQVIMNLVVNARDAMPEGGEIRIETAMMALKAPLSRDRATVAPGDYVIVRVTDSGTGIAPDKLSKIFEPFFTTKRQGEGTGLGLSTAYGIVKQTGGYIFCDSVPGSGTTFSLYFPAHDKVDAPDLSDAPLRPGRRLARAGEGVILLVEDEAPVRAFASRALRMRGYTVIEAENAEEALKTLRDSSLTVDVFVTDVIMPGLDGPSWVREALKERPNTRVIFVSGYAEESLNETRDRIPNSVFLPKPFSLSELTATVQGQIH
ncbi:MAG: response regulator [Rhodobacteraceae bacterium]|nr:response regulator [Paracoccaceae bacterium]